METLFKKKYSLYDLFVVVASWLLITHGQAILGILILIFGALLSVSYESDEE